MFERVNHIKLSGVQYPLKCDLLVLEKIQEEYRDLTEFENKLTGFTPNVDECGEFERNEEGYLIGTFGTPDIKTVRKALVWMIQEGIEIAHEEGNCEIESVTEKELLRKVDMSPRELGDVLKKEFSRCFERKNDQTTQRGAKTTEE